MRTKDGAPRIRFICTREGAHKGRVICDLEARRRPGRVADALFGYAKAREIAEAQGLNHSFNLTWDMLPEDARRFEVSDYCPTAHGTGPKLGSYSMDWLLPGDKRSTANYGRSVELSYSSSYSTADIERERDKRRELCGESVDTGEIALSLGVWLDESAQPMTDWTTVKMWCSTCGLNVTVSGEWLLNYATRLWGQETTTIELAELARILSANPYSDGTTFYAR